MSQLSELQRLYNESRLIQPFINPSLTGILALILLSLTAILISIGIFGEKSSVYGSIKYIVLSVLASLTFGFGSVFLSNYVGVYV